MSNESGPQSLGAQTVEGFSIVSMWMKGIIVPSLQVEGLLLIRFLCCCCFAVCFLDQVSSSPWWPPYEPRLALNLGSFCFNILNVAITRVCQHAQLVCFIF